MISLTDQQLEWLQEEKKRTGASLAEIIRRILQEKINSG